MNENEWQEWVKNIHRNRLAVECYIYVNKRFLPWSMEAITMKATAKADFILENGNMETKDNVKMTFGEK